MSNATTFLDRSQNQLQLMLHALMQWRAVQDAIKRDRHGHCLEAVRYAAEHSGLVIPPWRDRPNNIALWNGHEMVRHPDKYGWERVKPPFKVRLTLDYFAACGTLKDGRIAGHVALCDHQTRELISSTTYALDKFWLERRYASFVPAI